MTAQDTYNEVREEFGRPAPDAFDLPAALAARERRSAPEHVPVEPSAPVEPTPVSEDLPRVFVPWQER